MHVPTPPDETPLPAWGVPLPPLAPLTGDEIKAEMGRTEAAEERTMLERARQGEEAAYRWFLRVYRARAVRLAAHVLHSPNEAEDVAQEAFLRAFRSLGQFRGEGRFYTWLYPMVVRLCLDRRRRSHWKAEYFLETEGVYGTSEAAPEEEIHTRLVVHLLLERLSPPIRAALVLRELDGLEYEEIAQVLQIPVGTVRSRLNAARAQFRRLWEQITQETHHV